MLKTKRQKWINRIGLTLALVLTGASLLASTPVANAAEITIDDLRTFTQASTGPGLLGDGYLAHGGGGGPWGFKGEIDYKQLLADALGITVEELDAAYETARAAAIEQAVEEGLITREEADELLAKEGAGSRGLHLFRRGPRDASDTIDENALLAQALGITVEELAAARETANQAAITQAVAEGIITQEQADEMMARKSLKDYLNRDALLAKALGMSVEELQAAYAEGKTLSTLMDEKGLDKEAMQEALQAVYAEAIAQAVADGVITQEQADLVLDGHGIGLRELMGPGGHHGRAGRGRPDGEPPAAPDTDGDTSGTRSRPSRDAVQGKDAL